MGRSGRVLANREVCTRGWGCKLDFFPLLSIVWHASKQRRKPATRGMASQHLRTFEIGLSQCSQPGRWEFSDLPRLENYTLYNPATGS